MGIDLFDMVNWKGFVDHLAGMSMATAATPRGIVNFGDNRSAPTAAVPFWVARRARDPRSQWFGEELAGAYDEWSLIWHDAGIVPEAPAAGISVWRSDLDWIVARNGYAPDDLLVAMRSGGPSNHEHADRNSIIVKCFGEELVVDPIGAPYSFSDPSWMMRWTEGHSALLIDGKGHQYHDGSEGTNAALAEARIVRQSRRQGLVSWTSDATHAYHLVDDDVASVTRTLVVLHEIPAVIVLDKVRKTSVPSAIQARFFAFNSDGEGAVETDGSTFAITRPLARLVGITHSKPGGTAQTRLLPIPDDIARRHPFAEASTAEKALDSFLMTVLLPAPSSSDQTPSARIEETAEGVYEVRVEHGSRRATIRVFDTETVPEFELVSG
jgi:hypothetical protein